MRLKSNLKLIMVLAVLAMLVSLYLTYTHYKAEGAFCPAKGSELAFDFKVDCEVVNQSIYSELFGIPVAIFGFLTFLLLFILSWFIYQNKEIKFKKYKLTKKNILILMFLILAFSILFGPVYLAYIQFFVLYVICTFCLLLDLLIILMFIFSAINLRYIK